MRPEPILQPPGAATLARLRARLAPSEAPPAPRGFGDDAAAALAPPGPPKPAAVLAPLKARADGLHLILTVRAAHLARHAGQVSFPGGRVDWDDPTPAAAALREADEEIGLAPGDVELLGAFDPYDTVTGYRITPFVGLAPADFAPTPDPGEVADVFEVPLDYVLDPANRQAKTVFWNGAPRSYIEIPYAGRRIWGATAGMLKALAERLYG